MRMLLYIVIVVLLFTAPVQRLDVAKLEPVQTVAVSVENGEVVLQTDTQQKGRAETLQAAINDLEENTPGVIYLDTAQYLLYTQEAAAYAEALATYLHPAVKVSRWDGKGSVEDAAKYLSVRSDLPTVDRWVQKYLKHVKKR